MQYRLFTRAYLCTYVLLHAINYKRVFEWLWCNTSRRLETKIHSNPLLAECKSCFKSQQHLWLDAWSNHVLSNASYWSEIIAPCFYRPSWVRQSTVSASPVQCDVLPVQLWTAPGCWVRPSFSPHRTFDITGCAPALLVMLDPFYRWLSAI